MSFVVLRTAKIKTGGSIRGSLDHSFREREVKNADPCRAHENQVLLGGSNAEDVAREIRSRLDSLSKYRKDAVRVIEYLVTSGREAFEDGGALEGDQGAAYFAKSLKYIQDKHGAENVLSAVVHRDELTPHLVVYVVPEHEGKLNCRHYLGGDRHVLSELQTDFAEKVGRHNNLERGVEGSKAKHVDIKDWYAKLPAEIEKMRERFKKMKSRTEQLEDKAVEVDTWIKTAEEFLKKAGSDKQALVLASAENAKLLSDMKKIEKFLEDPRIQKIGEKVLEDIEKREKVGVRDF